jgi:uroporphyrinogen decarboxylase
MTPRQYVIEQINHRETSPVPYTLPIYPTVADAIDRHYGGAQWRDRIVKYGDIVRLVGYHAGVVDIDERSFRDAYGGVWQKDMNVHHHIAVPLEDPTLDGFEMPEPESLITPEALKAASEQREQSRDQFLLGEIGAGPWEFFWHLRGFQNALMDIAAEPVFAQGMFEKITEQLVAYVDLVADLPLDGIFLGDDWGGQDGVLLGPEYWRRYVKPSWKRVVEAAHRHDLPVFNHCCGSVAQIMPDIVEIGLDCLESVQPEAAGNDPYMFKREYGKDLTLWGGLGSQSIIPFGSPAELKAEIDRLVREMGRGGGYILSPAKALMPDTPVENAVAILEAFVQTDIN